jgi:cytoskeletal protein RodZ
VNLPITGTQLKAHRERLQMAIEDVANRLLLSPRQVRALEDGLVSAFYNQSFFNQAQTRYLELLGLSVADTPPPFVSGAGIDRVTPSPVAPMLSAERPPTPSAPRTVVDTDKAPSSTLAIVLAVLTLIGVGAYTVYYTQTPNRPPRELPPAREAAQPAPEVNTAPVDTAIVEPPNPVDTPAIDVVPIAPPAAPLGAASPTVAPPTPDATVPPTSRRSDIGFVIHANGLCWVFARDASGRETEVTLRAGEDLQLARDLNYLAIGDVTAIELRFGNQTRDIVGLAKDRRVLRLNQTELSRLRGE